MSGPKRNPDRLNTIGVVVVGICGAVLVYVTIVALQAFYVNDTSEIQTMADYGGQDTGAKSLRTEQLNRIGEYGTNPRPQAAKANEAQRPQTYRVPIDVAMKRVVADAKEHSGELVPSLGRSDKPTVLPIFGRPKLLPPPAAAPGGAAAPPAPGAGSGSGSGSAVVAPPAAPLVPTGTGTGPSPVSGAGPLASPAPPPAAPGPNPPATSKQPPPAAPAPNPPPAAGKQPATPAPKGNAP
jgi:hypothetical protein